VKYHEVTLHQLRGQGRRACRTFGCRKDDDQPSFRVFTSVDGGASGSMASMFEMPASPFQAVVGVVTQVATFFQTPSAPTSIRTTRAGEANMRDALRRAQILDLR